jgi:hypothetical protein
LALLAIAVAFVASVVVVSAAPLEPTSREPVQLARPLAARTCLQECVISAQRVYERCRDDGGGKEDCQQEAKERFDYCAGRCRASAYVCPPSYPGSLNCLNECLKVAHLDYCACRATKGHRDCLVVFKARYQDCVVHCPVRKQ